MLKHCLSRLVAVNVCIPTNLGYIYHIDQIHCCLISIMLSDPECQTNPHIPNRWKMDLSQKCFALTD